ncbi:MAG: hypothetical protein OXS30_06405 [Chloroflexota bacterium]|nr:hypothetical protein [Chloroflexota bacterium]
MKSRFTLSLVLSFAGGVLLMAGVGGGLRIFDRGPTDIDVSEARERGVEEATAEVDARMQAVAEERGEAGYQRGREAVEWLSLDRLPNPDSWFAGVVAGRKQLEQLAEEAFRSGFESGQRQGRDEALGFVRTTDSGPGHSDDPEEQ